MNNYIAKVGTTSFELAEEEVTGLDLVTLDETKFHLLFDHKAYHIEVEGMQFEEKLVQLKVNGTSMTVQIEDHFDILVRNMGLTTYSSQTQKVIKAPMPGLILDIAVSAGEQVKKGDHLIILEAMKMENILKSDGDGTIKAINVAKGDAVEKGQLLIEME